MHINYYQILLSVDFKVYPSIIIKFYLVNFFVLFLTIFGLEAGVSAIASERLDFHVSRKF